MDEDIKIGKESNGQVPAAGESREEEIGQSTERESIALSTLDEPVKLTWNELRVELSLEVDNFSIRFQGKEALQVIRWINSL